MAPSRAARQDNNFKLSFKLNIESYWGSFPFVYGYMNLDEAFRKNYHWAVVLTTDGEADDGQHTNPSQSGIHPYTNIDWLLTDTFRDGRGSSRGWQEAEANCIYYSKYAPIKVQILSFTA
ncbi:hypothetical protein Tco_0453147 [Tanacetum coccineum]